MLLNKSLIVLDKVDQFQQIIFLTERMLDEARSLAWEQVADMEVTRRQSIAAFFNDSVPAELSLKIAQCINTILMHDQEIIRLGQQAKHDLEVELRQIEYGKKAVKAYSS